MLELLSQLKAEEEQESMRSVVMELAAKMLVKFWEFGPTSDTGGAGIFPDTMPRVIFDDEASKAYGRLSPAVICEILTYMKEDRRSADVLSSATSLHHEHLRRPWAGRPRAWPWESVPPACSCPLKPVAGELISPDPRAWSMYLERGYNGMTLTYALTFANINSIVEFYTSSLVKLEITSRPKFGSILLTSQERFDNIRHLVVRSISFALTQEELMHVISSVRYVCVASFSEGTPADHAVVAELVRRCGSHLQHLGLVFNPNITDETVTLIAQRCSMLKRLWLNGCDKLTYRSYQAVYDGCPSLTDIGCFCHISKEMNIPDDTFEINVQIGELSFGPWEEVYHVHNLHHPVGDGKRPTLQWHHGKRVLKVMTLPATPLFIEFLCVLQTGASRESGRDWNAELKNEACGEAHSLDAIIKTGDEVLEVDGRDLRGAANFDEARELLGWPWASGTHVKLLRSRKSRWLEERNINAGECGGCSILWQRGICNHD